MISKIIPLSLVLGALAVPSFSATDCSRESLAGRWFGGDFEAVCRIDLRENGRIRGFCIDSWEDFINGEWIRRSERFDLSGNFNIDSECKARLRLVVEDDEGTDVVVFHGRFTGSASSRPDLANLSTGPNSEPALNITLHRD
ncbi:MAG: hypothetical protein ACK4NW_03880 [Roseinatronobacter sp.]